MPVISGSPEGAALVADLRALVGENGVLTGERLRSRVYDKTTHSFDVSSSVTDMPRYIGLERKPYLEISRTSAEIAAMRALRAALDPRGIVNPGKVIDVH